MREAIGMIELSSVGVGYLRDAGKDLYGLMLMADKALYRAKEAGRNQMVEYDGV